MRNLVAVLFIMVCMAYIVACGGSSTSSSIVMNKDDLQTSSVPYSSVLGARIPSGPLSFTNYSVSTLTGSSAGFSNYSRATSPVAKFNRPIAITADSTNLYVADYLNNAIRKITIATQNDITFAGSPFGFAGSAGGNGTAASFNLPRDVTSDGINLYVADSGNYTIRKIVIATGEVSLLAGGIGLPGSVDSTVGTNARFNDINGITTDGICLYVTDSNNTIRRIKLVAPYPVTTLAGSPGTTGSANGKQDVARFNLPNRITTDGPNLYVTDFYNNTIRKIVINTGEVTTIAGIPVPSGSHVDSTVADPTGRSARFNQPNGIITDGVNLYVTDSYDNTVRKILINSGIVGESYSGPVTTIAGNASGVAGGFKDGVGTVATFNKPIGITTDGVSLYIADNQNHKIRKIQ